MGIIIKFIFYCIVYLIGRGILDEMRDVIGNDVVYIIILLLVVFCIAYIRWIIILVILLFCFGLYKMII